MASTIAAGEKKFTILQNGVLPTSWRSIAAAAYQNAENGPPQQRAMVTSNNIKPRNLPVQKPEFVRIA